MFWLLHIIFIFVAPPLLFLSIPLHILVSVMKGNRNVSKEQISELKAIREAIEQKHNATIPADQVMPAESAKTQSMTFYNIGQWIGLHWANGSLKWALLAYVVIVVVYYGFMH